MSPTRTLSLWLPPLGFMAAVLLLAQPPSGDVSWTLVDKPLHIVAYAVLGALSLRATHGGTSPMRLAPAVVALLMTVGFGAFDEWNQARIPRRESSVADWFADLVGALLALGLWWACFGRRRARLPATVGAGRPAAGPGSTGASAGGRGRGSQEHET